MLRLRKAATRTVAPEINQMSFMATITTTEPARCAMPVLAPIAGERPLLFLDFEASSLSPASWPVEIGWAWIAGGRVRSRATLIAPRPAWSLADWSEGAARVHGIPLGDVLDGAPADDVAAATDAFAAFEVVSDNAAWEQRWLDRLREGRPRIEVRPLRQAMLARLTPSEADRLGCGLFRADPRHRAAADAERLAGAWLAAIDTEPMAA